MSALGLKERIENVGYEIREMCGTKSDSGKVYLFHETSEEVKQKLDAIRLNPKQKDLGNEKKNKKGK